MLSIPFSSSSALRHNVLRKPIKINFHLEKIRKLTFRASTALHQREQRHFGLCEVIKGAIPLMEIEYIR